jgi:disulfide bond formation protein DsbB
MPYAAYIIIAASFGSLAFAFIMQYGFDVQPCVLCLWQRVPFAFAALLAAASFIGRSNGDRTRVLLALCAILFLANTGLAIFHSGVERHWWEGTRGCHITPLHNATIDSLRERILNTAVGHCDVISWTFLGLSMANWNIPFSFGLALFAFAAFVCQGCKKP